MKKKFIILVNSLKQGGAEKVVQDLCKFLDQDFEVHLITLDEEKFFDLPPNVIYRQFRLNKFFRKLFPINLLIFSFMLFKYLKKYDIKLVQSHLLTANYVNLLTKVLFKNHKAHIVNHSLINRFKFEGLKGKVHLFLIKKLYKYADINVCVSKTAKKEIDSIVETNSIVIYNGINITNIKKLSKEPVTDFSFKKNTFYIIFVGRLNKIKRPELAIELMNKLNIPNIELLFLGKEEDIEFKDLIKKSKHPNKIHYLGIKKNPYKYMKNSHLLLITSKSESFSNTLLESVACNCIPISSKCGGPEEILEENFKDLLYSNIEELKNIIIKLTDFNQRKNLIQNLKFLLENFRIERTIEEYKKLIQKELS